MPTAVIVDNSPLVRAQLRQILTGIGAAVVAEAATRSDVAAMYEQHRPDLVTMDAC